MPLGGSIGELHPGQFDKSSLRIRPQEGHPEYSPFARDMRLVSADSVIPENLTVASLALVNL